MTYFAVNVQAWLCKNKGMLPVQLILITEIWLCTLQVHSLNCILMPRIRSIVAFILKYVYLFIVQYFLTVSSERKKKKQKQTTKNQNQQTSQNTWE